MPKSIKGMNNNNDNNTPLHIHKHKKNCFTVQKNILKNLFEERTREADVTNVYHKTCSKYIADLIVTIKKRI